MKTLLLQEIQVNSCSDLASEETALHQHTAYGDLPQLSHLHYLKLNPMNIPTNTMCWFAVIHCIPTMSQHNVKNHILLV